LYIEGGILSELSSKLSDNFRRIFNDEMLKLKAKSVGFLKRDSKFSPIAFLDTLLYIASQTEICSLVQASTRVQDYNGVSISKQGVDSRFNEKSVEFVKGVFKECLENEFNKVIAPSFFSAFSRVLIKDATRFIIPDKLAEHFKGAGSRNGKCKAAVGIQYEYDIKNGKTTDLEVTDATRCDLTDAKETRFDVRPGDLIIRDLGYFSLSILAEFDRKNAFFLSRLNVKCNVFEDEKGPPISFKEIYKYMSKNKIPLLEEFVFTGVKEKLPVRMVVQLVSDDVYEKRIRKIEKQNKTDGYNTSDDYKARCRLNIFITNVDTKDLAKEDVYAAYKIRWQIELMFKHWKSTCKIHNFQPMKYERFTCLLYAKLILIVLNLQLIRNFQSYYFTEHKKLLSEDKCFKTLTKGFERLLRIIKKESTESITELLKIAELFSREHWKEKRIDRVNYFEIISLFTCISDN
jgi:Transposase DDE domain